MSATNRIAVAFALIGVAALVYIAWKAVYRDLMPFALLFNDIEYTPIVICGLGLIGVGAFMYSPDKKPDTPPE